MDKKDNVLSTPIRNKTGKTMLIPPSPFMKKIGFGTGVCVYEYQRSPLASKIRSPWAIKKLSKSKKGDIHLNERLKWEAEVLRKLQHPNIVGFRAHLKSNAGNILAMEECSACLGNLIEERRENGPLSPYSKNIIIKVGLDISSALNYLHNTALILHCDIKSFNILIKGDFNICKLCDFGVCLPLKKDGTIDEEKAGDEYEYTGTPMWSPPEVMKFPQKVSSKADIYSFGLVLQEMLTLTIPITEDMMESMDISNEDEEEFDALAMNDSIEYPHIDMVVYKDIIDLINMCTSSEPKHRPSSRKLEGIFRGLTLKQT
ncbi:lymphokine-activated killer T-cell-originated protein kinase-like [Coccinella septempunctata]|uniref:lymphokine-activated killer T-cell-originated protein kinase-like n=1 Tax=Coccinella septempunctata TaxID=41139 RepID=UPI001D06BCA3|nr:lymphokine-activated killer T-cell-originated protein kinase-like [Coccinella septempunctata]